MVAAIAAEISIGDYRIIMLGRQGERQPLAETR